MKELNDLKAISIDEIQGFEQANSIIRHLEQVFYHVLLEYLLPAANQNEVVQEELKGDEEIQRSMISDTSSQDISNLMQNLERFKKDLTSDKNELIVIGNTKAGKSTFLNYVTRMRRFFNTNVKKETSCMWRYTIGMDQQNAFSFQKKANQLDDQIKERAPQKVETGTLYLDNEEQLIQQIVLHRAQSAAQNPVIQEEELKDGSDNSVENSSMIEDSTKNGIEIGVNAMIASQRGFRLISEFLDIIDVPGIDDEQNSLPIKAYIEQNYSKAAPVILIKLTQGGIDEIKHFHNILPCIRMAKFSPIVIFTQFENLKGIIKTEQLAQDEEDQVERTDEEIEVNMKNELRCVILKFYSFLLEKLPTATFYIFDPNSSQYKYRFCSQPVDVKFINSQEQANNYLPMMTVEHSVRLMQQSLELTASRMHISKIVTFMREESEKVFNKIVEKYSLEKVRPATIQRLRNVIEDFKTNCNENGSASIQDIMRDSIIPSMSQSVLQFAINHKNSNFFCILQKTYKKELFKYSLDTISEMIVNLYLLLHENIIIPQQNLLIEKYTEIFAGLPNYDFDKTKSLIFQNLNKNKKNTIVHQLVFKPLKLKWYNWTRKKIAASFGSEFIKFVEKPTYLKRIINEFKSQVNNYSDLYLSQINNIVNQSQNIQEQDQKYQYLEDLHNIPFNKAFKLINQFKESTKEIASL